MKLYFVRHGETEWNVKKKIQGKTDIPLNENGIRQAKELACQLVEEDISVKHVYHSPQLRAAETARIAAEALHATCIPLDGLVEMNLKLPSQIFQCGINRRHLLAVNKKRRFIRFVTVNCGRQPFRRSQKRLHKTQRRRIFPKIFHQFCLSNE